MAMRTQRWQGSGAKRTAQCTLRMERVVALLALNVYSRIPHDFMFKLRCTKKEKGWTCSQICTFACAATEGEQALSPPLPHAPRCSCSASMH